MDEPKGSNTHEELLSEIRRLNQNLEQLRNEVRDQFSELKPCYEDLSKEIKNLTVQNCQDHHLLLQMIRRSRLRPTP